MSETEKHKDLKKLAHLILYKEGFKESEIQEEYYFRVPDSKKRFRIDVIGIMDEKWGEKKKIAVELGTTNPKKLAQLELFFDKVIHIPYGIEGFNGIELEQIMIYKKENEKLQTEVKKLKDLIGEKENAINSYEKSLEYENMASDAVDAIRAVLIGIVKHQNLYYAVRHSQDAYCTNYPYDPKKTEKDKLIEDIYKLLFMVDEIE